MKKLLFVLLIGSFSLNLFGGWRGCINDTDCYESEYCDKGDAGGPVIGVCKSLNE